MLNFFFTSNAFEVAPAIQAINDVLFPLVLFLVIFMFLCSIVLDNPLKVSDEENVAVERVSDSQVSEVIASRSVEETDLILETQLASMVAVMEQYTEPQEPKANLYDVEQEINKLQALGARSLKSYCKEHKLSGYSSAANIGVEALAKFMLARQVKAHDVEKFRSKIVA
ncbi:hypothetical protein CAL7716_100740 (plasmid) [Calothrix sp. PCC 7716]|nr:hypothetical protein CAL7716_100740 [Calothrix sp. PCC 7716]